MFPRTILSPALLPRRPWTALQRALSSSSSFNKKPNNPPTALVLGSCGALGSVVSTYLAQNVGMRVIGADVVDDDDEASSKAATRNNVHAYCRLPVTGSVPELSAALSTSVQAVLRDFGTDTDDDDPVLLDVVVCANGGWQGDPPSSSSSSSVDDDDDNDNAIQASATVLQNMLQVNLHPVLATAMCIQNATTTGSSSSFLSDRALVVVMGATAALSPTPGMLAYGTSKAAVHHVVQTLGAATAKHNNNHNNKYTILGLLPTTLDTPANRAAMPTADTTTWTQPADVAHQIGTWIHTPSLRPASGSLVKVYTSNDGQATFQLVR